MGSPVCIISKVIILISFSYAYSFSSLYPQNELQIFTLCFLFSSMGLPQ